MPRIIFEEFCKERLNSIIFIAIAGSKQKYQNNPQLRGRSIGVLPACVFYLSPDPAPTQLGAIYPGNKIGFRQPGCLETGGGIRAYDGELGH
jgi:hypothetical protein